MDHFPDTSIKRRAVVEGFFEALLESQGKR
jgi:hypothetical protein